MAGFARRTWAVEEIATRFYRWRRNGTLFKVFKTLQAQADGKGLLDWEMHCVDSTVIRAHQHAAGGKKGLLERSAAAEEGSVPKIHLRTDRQDNPLVLALAGGEKHDAPQLVRLVDAGEIKRVGRGRPRLRPERLAGDKGYDSAALRTALRRRGIEPIIPSRSNRIRIITFDRARYRERNVIERCINRLKQWRRVATRYEKLAANYVAVILIAATMHFVNLLL